MKSKFQTPLLAVDGLLVKEGKILLVKRAIEPFKGYWTLPGGRIEYGEEAESSLRREMKEELGIEARIKKLVGVYSDPKRDPRAHTISIAYLIESKSNKPIKLNFEAKEYKFFSLNNLPKKIGFDHRKIIFDCKKILSKDS